MTLSLPEVEMNTYTISPTRQLVIIDSAVADPAQLQPDLPANYGFIR